jgi:septal ring-binding cell division protein DamX
LIISLSFVAYTNVYAQSNWDCDKTDANWNCAEKNTDQSTDENIPANDQQTITTTNKSSADSDATDDSAIESRTDNDQALDPLSRPSKFSADAYSIQLLASGSKDKIIGLIKQYRIPSLIIEHSTADQTLYLWIAGTYYSNDKARIALEQLPTLPPNITSWVRPTYTIADMPVLVRARL